MLKTSCFTSFSLFSTVFFVFHRQENVFHLSATGHEIRTEGGGLRYSARYGAGCEAWRCHEVDEHHLTFNYLYPNVSLARFHPEDFERCQEKKPLCQMLMTRYFISVRFDKLLWKVDFKITLSRDRRVRIVRIPTALSSAKTSKKIPSVSQRPCNLTICVFV